MKKLTVVLALTVALGAVVPLRAQESNPAAVLSQLGEALNQGDVEAALQLVAEDAVLTFVPDLAGTGPVEGKEAIRGWYEYLVSQNLRVEPSNLQVNGDTVTWENQVWMDDFEALGIAPVSYTGEGVVQEGKIMSYSETMTQASMAQLQAATAALPETGSRSGAFVLVSSILGLGMLLLGVGLKFGQTRNDVR